MQAKPRSSNSLDAWLLPAPESPLRMTTWPGRSEFGAGFRPGGQRRAVSGVPRARRSVPAPLRCFPRSVARASPLGWRWPSSIAPGAAIRARRTTRRRRHRPGPPAGPRPWPPPSPAALPGRSPLRARRRPPTGACRRASDADRPRHPSIAVRRERQVGEGVLAMPVVPGRDQDRVRVEGIHLGKEPAAPGIDERRVVRTGRAA